MQPSDRRVAGAPGALAVARHRVRDGARRGARSARAYARSAAGSAGALPSFVIAGAQRCGTTSLYLDLCRHPQVLPPAGKELQFFTLHHGRGLGWYRGCFPRLGPGQHTFEASPYYLVDPAAPRRLAADLPDAKVVVLLRDPVARAVSHHLHSVRTGAERLPLAEALAAEPDRTARALRHGAGSARAHRVLRRHSYVRLGRYGEQLERWVAAVGRERLHVVRSEDLHARPGPAHAALLDFLGLDPAPLVAPARHTRRAATAGPDPLPQARELLAGAFDDDTPRLLAATGWSRAW